MQNVSLKCTFVKLLKLVENVYEAFLFCGTFLYSDTKRKFLKFQVLGSFFVDFLFWGRSRFLFSSLKEA